MYSSPAHCCLNLDVLICKLNPACTTQHALKLLKPAESNSWPAANQAMKKEAATQCNFKALPSHCYPAWLWNLLTDLFYLQVWNFFPHRTVIWRHIARFAFHRATIRSGICLRVSTGEVLTNELGGSVKKRSARFFFKLASCKASTVRENLTAI